MNESADPQHRTTREMKAVSKKDTGRERQVMDERCVAARRWIDVDDEPAIRGID
ncbi:MAG TPA: hypothetical protein VMZ53_01840 [Kofleriaceae bacterium]|nr:hypothetical protein [Kofleriaceae bacterium]